MGSSLEHLNVTVADPSATADMLCTIFGWHVRWQGPGMTTGHTVHVGSATSYVALFTFGGSEDATEDTYRHKGGLNHIGVTVDDLDAVERKVIAAGYRPRSHADYEPGRRFYFEDENGIEFEVVSYT